MEIGINEFQCKPFNMIEKGWFIITAKRGEDNANAMTANWAGIGYLWRKPVAFIFIRPQRFTHGLVESERGFSVALFDEAFREKLTFCGEVSGRDTDKAKKCGFTVLWQDGIPYFAEANTVFFCRKLAKQPILPNGFIDGTIDEKIYPKRDYHDLYVSEILKIIAQKV
jgi:flavin reductase (DIM6/NTAB) family NADH-FMN oxidoreductase RutF